MSSVAESTTKFVRKDSNFRDSVKADGSTPFAPEKDRYHLYVSYSCPFAHRALIGRALKGLEDVIPVTAVDPVLDSSTGLGWRFVEKKGEIEGCAPDPLYGVKFMKELYLKAYPQYDGRFSVPVLWDRKHETIVNNESAEVLRIFNSEFNSLAKNPGLDLYPEHLRAKIDEFNSWIAPSINLSVYRCGFAQTQQEYDVAVEELFNALDKVEQQLSKTRYLTGSTLTEADVRLFTTLLRFDAVYFVLYKCSKKMIKDYPNIFGFLCDLYQMPEVKGTVRLDHVTRGYFASQKNVNPNGIVPVGPIVDFNAPHNRDKM